MVNFFIHRPVFASVIAVIMVLTGLIAYSLLPVAQFPEHHATAGGCHHQTTRAPVPRSSPAP